MGIMTEIDDRALEPVKVMARDLKTNRMVEIGVAMRRQSDARLWAWLAKEPDFERAAIRIGTAFAHIDRGIGLQQSILAKAMADYSGSIDPSHIAGLIFDYFAWGKACAQHRPPISHAAIMDVLAYGKPCRLVDQERRRRNGWTKEQLAEGLWLYCQLRGWRKAA